MKATKEALSPTRVKLTVEVPFEELKPSLDSAYKSLAQQVRIPGFRPGKVPPRVLDQRFGRGYVLDQALQEALPQLYSQAVAEEELDVLSQPEVDITQFEDNSPLVFTAEVDVRPEFELPDVDALEISVDDAEVDEDAVNSQLDSLRDRFSTLVPAERPVQDGDVITIDLSATVNGDEVPEASSTGMSYEVGRDNLVQGLDDAVRGASEDDERTFQTTLLAGEHAGETADVTVKIRSVKEKERPELDDDFATTASEFDTLDELRADIRSRLERVKKLEQGMQARDRVLDRLLELVEMPLPESVVQSEIEARNQSLDQQLSQIGATRATYLETEGKSEEEFDAEVREGAERAVKAQFVLDALAQKKELNVEQEELTDQLIRRAQQAQMAPQDYANQLMQSGQVGMLMAEVLRGKALAEVLESAKITDASGREVDLNALNEGVADLSGAAEEELDEEVAELDDPEAAEEPASS